MADWSDVAPALVATDIDGTIVPHGGTVSDRTRRVLHDCAGAGIPVVLVTGRPPRWLPPVVGATNLATTAICANGAIVLDTSDFSVRALHTIGSAVAAQIVLRLRAAVPDIVVAAEAPTELRASPEYVRARATGWQSEGLAPADHAIALMGSIDEMLASEEIVKLVVLSPGSAPDHFLDVARAKIGHLAHVTRSAMSEALLEIGPHGVTKASTLATHAHGLGVAAEDVVAFGDMPNDVEMLSWAGRGYAMAQAHPDAVAAARHRAPAVEEDGVAQVLEAMLAKAPA